jgi:hypothetical protein
MGYKYVAPRIEVKFFRVFGAFATVAAVNSPLLQ